MFSTWAERHTFLIGFFEVLCPWRPGLCVLPESVKLVKGEEHYYLAGRGLGFPVLSLILTALVKLFKEVIF